MNTSRNPQGPSRPLARSTSAGKLSIVQPARSALPSTKVDCESLNSKLVAFFFDFFSISKVNVFFSISAKAIAKVKNPSFTVALHTLQIEKTGTCVNVQQIWNVEGNVNHSQSGLSFILVRKIFLKSKWSEKFLGHIKICC